MEKIGNDYHIPVLYYETLDNLVINPDGVYIGSELCRSPHTADGDNSTFAASSPGLTLFLCKMGTETFLARWWGGSAVHIKALVTAWL